MAPITNESIIRLSKRLKKPYCDFFYSQFGTVDPSPTHFDVEFEITKVTYLASTFIHTLASAASEVGLRADLIVTQLEAYVANTYFNSLNSAEIDTEPELQKSVRTNGVTTLTETAWKELRKAKYLNEPMPFDEMVVDLKPIDRFLKGKIPNEYIYIGPFEIYVRKSKRDLGNGYYRCFDIARVGARVDGMRGKGYFTLFLAELERHLIDRNTTIYVECVHNKRLGAFLERRGYTSDKSDIAPCYLLEHPGAFLG